MEHICFNSKQNFFLRVYVFLNIIVILLILGCLQKNCWAWDGGWTVIRTCWIFSSARFGRVVASTDELRTDMFVCGADGCPIMRMLMDSGAVCGWCIRIWIRGFSGSGGWTGLNCCWTAVCLLVVSGLLMIGFGASTGFVSWNCNWPDVTEVVCELSVLPHWID